MKSRLLLPISLFGLSASTGLSAVLYSSDSDWNVTATSNLSAAKWYAAGGRSNFYSVVNTNGTTANSADNRRGGVVFGNDTSGLLNNYLYFQNFNTTTTNFDYFAHTAATSNFVAFSPQNYSALTASWVVNRDGFADGGYFVAVQVSGTQWYASRTNAALQTALGTVSIDLLASQWVTITENQNEGSSGTAGSIVLGSTPISYATLFSGGQQITGVGFYADNMDAANMNALRTIRIDNFTIQDVIPEPSAALSGILGAGLLVLRRRR